METARIAQEIESLPVDAQRQVFDFVAFLKTRYPVGNSIKKNIQNKLSDEPFIGMWQGREDMQDSIAWVKNLRRREWKRSL